MTRVEEGRDMNEGIAELVREVLAPNQVDLPAGYSDICEHTRRCLGARDSDIFYTRCVEGKNKNCEYMRKK